MSRAVGAENRDGTLVRLVRVLVALTVVLIAVAAGGVVRSESLGEKVDRIEASETSSAKVGADTLAEMRAALEQQREGPNSEAVVEGLAAIARMEHEMCGGPCPPVDPGD